MLFKGFSLKKMVMVLAVAVLVISGISTIPKSKAQFASLSVAQIEQEIAALQAQLAALLASTGSTGSVTTPVPTTPPAYPPVTVTSPTNTSLTVTATPLSFDGTNWTYQLNWTRVRQTNGSVYVTLQSNKSVQVLAVDNAIPTGSATMTLIPSTQYRVEFYTQPSGQGSLLVRKFFTTLAAVASTPTTTPTPIVTPTPTPTLTGNQTTAAVSNLDSLSPNHGKGGDTISINGKNFDSAPANNKIYIYSDNNVIRTVEASSQGAGPYVIQFTVPADMYAGTYQLKVRSGSSGALSNALTLTVDSPTSTPTPTPSPTPTPTPASSSATATLMANLSTIQSGGMVTLTWSLSNSPLCASGGGWNGDSYLPGTNGSMQVGPIYSSQTFKVSCYNYGYIGTAEAFVTVTVSSAAVSNLDSLSPNHGKGGDTISINGKNFDSAPANNKIYIYSDNNVIRTVEASSQGAGPYVIQFTVPADMYAGTYQLKVRSGSSGALSNALTLTVDSPDSSNSGPPTATLSANPASVTSGGSTTLTWSSTNATQGCLTSWFKQTVNSSGSQIVVPVTSNQNYNITCYNSSGQSASASVTVPVH